MPELERNPERGDVEAEGKRTRERPRERLAARQARHFEMEEAVERRPAEERHGGEREDNSEGGRPRGRKVAAAQQQVERQDAGKDLRHGAESEESAGEDPAPREECPGD